MTEPHRADPASQMLDFAEGPRCVADTTRIRAWLTSPSNLPGYAAFTVAETWQISDDMFFWDADSIGALMGTLVEQSQRAGVFGVSGYGITLRHLATGDDTGGPIEHQITLTGPSGVVYASAPIATD